ncbi:phosphate/phosphite/phosphonate ABC transporter substrate-binding protein [Luteipulveratus mongoliensis]|uniref:Phosphonate ABC transporter substrate-binding protein n=1 Tax=Luteipulveratus mongoliensis TaxID=571913 RepID=A0A0K1JER7_9MICO|nr:phosphate/phosphite/phosphonate ABC transporter substrate-binding protein [Luteipulveratus mongoliensis]AKU15093.1 phosphonate ABC transporter substrate-binding protein [Luteipulveratus mongoliensis]
MRFHRSVALASTALIALTLASCSSDADGAESGAKKGANGIECPNKGTVRFGVEPFEDPAKLTPAFKVLAGALEKKLGCKVEMTVVADYSAEVLAMRNGKLEIAQFGPLGYVFASSKADAQPVASFGDSKGQLSTYKAGLWVKKDSPITSVAQLRGKQVALGSTGSTSGDAFPRLAMRKAGLQDSDVKLKYAGGHPQALLALTNGKVDAAEINTQQQATATEAGKFKASDYRQIWASDPIPNDPITVSGKLDPKFREGVAKALLELSPADVAKVGAFLDVTPPGPLVKVEKSTYQPLFDLASTLKLTEKDA